MPPRAAGTGREAAGVAEGDRHIENIKLPRGRGLKLSRAQLIRIGGTLFLLIFLLVMQKPCANAVSKFVTGFDDQGSAGSAMPKPGNVDMPGSGSEIQYEHLRPGMTDEEVKQVIDRAKARNAGSGSAAN